MIAIIRALARRAAVSGLLGCLLISLAGAQDDQLADEPNPGINFRGWTGCRQLSNADTQVTIIPAVGARVAFFCWRCINVLLVDEKLNGTLLRGDAAWMPWDGSQPDTLCPSGTAPGGGSQLKDVWMGSYEVDRATKLYLKCHSKDNLTAGLRMEKEFALDPRKPVLTIKRRLTNLSSKPARWSFWERTLTPAGSIGVAPVNPQSRFGRGWAIRQGDKYVAGPSGEANPRVVGDCLVVRTTGEGACAALDAASGWTAAVANGLLFLTKYPFWPDREYPWGSGLSNAFFFAQSRLELEPMSPYFDLAPGGSAEWAIQWRLEAFGTLPKDDSELVKRVKRTVNAVGWGG